MAAANFAIAERISTDLTTADTDHNEVAKASAYLNQIRHPADFFEWLTWMATPRVSEQLARSKRTPEYYKQINHACQQLKSITDVDEIAQTLAWAVRLMRYYPRARPVTPERAVARQTVGPSSQRQPPFTSPSAGTSKPVPAPGLSINELRSGMELSGTVKRVEKFGAFVDVGVGRDGLIHVSRLAKGYIAGVEDVVNVGQAVTVWVHEVDVKAGRIGLTLLRPQQVIAQAIPVSIPVVEPPTVQPPPARPAAIQVTALEQVKEGVWIKGIVRKIENNRIIVDIGLADGASLTFDRLPGKPTYPDEVAERWPAGSALEIQVVGVNKRGVVQLTLR